MVGMIKIENSKIRFTFAEILLFSDIQYSNISEPVQRHVHHVQELWDQLHFYP